MRSLFLTMALASAVVLTACDDGPATSPPLSVEIASAPHVAWLSRHLPSSTIGYARVPLIWDAWFRPRENALSNPQSLAVHGEQIDAIRAGLAANIWQQLPAQAQAPLTLLFNQVESPLEVAFLLPPDGSLVPNFLVGTTLALASNQTFATLLNELIGASDQLRILTPLDDRGFATLFTGPLPMYLHFEAGSGRLRLLSGASATQPFLEQSVALAAGATAVTEIERNLDASGRGSSVWLDVATLWPLASTMLPPAQKQMLTVAGVDRMRSVWMGSGSRGGRSQLRLQVEMPSDAGIRRLLPVPGAPVKVVSRGTPRVLMQLGLPTREELWAAADFVLDLMPNGAELRQDRDVALARFRDWMGVDAGLVLDAYGPEITLVGDDSGWWAAYQLRDRGAAQQLSSALAAKAGTGPESRTIGSVEYHSWSLPSLMSLSDEWQSDIAMDGMPPLARDLLTRLGSHLYWIEEPPYQIVAGIPQILMARGGGEAHFEVSRWLAETMDVDSRYNIALLALRNDDVARNVYHYYLSMVQLLADVAGVAIDPYAMPAWDLAGLPASGGIAMGIQSSPQALSLHLNFQYSPMELLLGADSLVGVALVGIAAAVAIPAYQEYQARTQVSRAMGVLSTAQGVITQQRLQQNRNPTAEELAAAVTNYSGGKLDYDPDSGALTIYFSADHAAGIVDGYLSLVPVEVDDTVRWDCRSDLAEKYLPPDCRPKASEDQASAPLD